MPDGTHKVAIAAGASIKIEPLRQRGRTARQINALQRAAPANGGFA